MRSTGFLTESIDPAFLGSTTAVLQATQGDIGKLKWDSLSSPNGGFSHGECFPCDLKYLVD